jgi:hypothetical protein
MGARRVCWSVKNEEGLAAIVRKGDAYGMARPQHPAHLTFAAWLQQKQHCEQEQQRRQHEQQRQNRQQEQRRQQEQEQKQQEQQRSGGHREPPAQAPVAFEVAGDLSSMDESAQAELKAAAVSSLGIDPALVDRIELQ